ncbi:hypothetical protein, partial [Phaeobacter italicus]|uniref:hypothetical protein n=1 Tax=Phaeobacter italicus TaxID=481446 RepID=UPI00295F35A8
LLLNLTSDIILAFGRFFFLKTRLRRICKKRKTYYRSNQRPVPAGTSCAKASEFPYFTGHPIRSGITEPRGS